MDSAETIIGIIGILGICTAVGLSLFLFIFWICMMVSSLRNKAIPSTDRLIWFGLMFGLFFMGIGGGWIVAIVYYFTDRRKQFKCKCGTESRPPTQ